MTWTLCGVVGIHKAETTFKHLSIIFSMAGHTFSLCLVSLACKIASHDIRNMHRELNPIPLSNLCGDRR